MELKNKVVVITGGSKGFGRALAEDFIKEGSKVVICSQNKDELQKVAKEIDATAIIADVKNEEELTSLAQKTIKEFGQIDIWVNNAGIWLPHANTEDLNMEEVKAMFDVNV